jgi:hypothetical protein
MDHLLPVCRPSIISYIHHANYLSVAEVNENARHYLVNCFLHLYTVKDSIPSALAVDFYMYDGTRPRYPFVSKATLTAGMLRHLSPGGVVDASCKILDAGSYVEPTLDEYYISEKFAYRKFHFPHKSLIYGYSAERRIFYAQGYTKDFDFKKFTISFDEYRDAFEDKSGKGFGDGMWLTILTLSKARNDSAHLRFSPELISQYLKDFLESRPSFVHHRPEESVFGRAVYEAAINKVAKHNRRNIDVRAWCVMHEHKLQLLRLHDYMVNEAKLDLPKRTRDGIVQLGDDFLALKNYLTEAAYSNSEVKVEALRNNLAAATEREPALLNDLIEVLDRQ